ncbi:hypothetical protein [Kingella kingae]|uniref:Uncharacterized protein n=1 Tax=Kingella kingae ATCC 23330 TaxID=887327 RepID=F5S6Y9_KINKI|nr:hypothetical protein [Kingella kingae]EGK09308.1 hypothetical protein HMPREF0476_0972 [Kingella kingae ATCC 23330]MDK4536629.1 hypothetical protein [Kingella kingae]
MNSRFEQKKQPAHCIYKKCRLLFIFQMWSEHGVAPPYPRLNLLSDYPIHHD